MQWNILAKIVTHVTRQSPLAVIICIKTFQRSSPRLVCLSNDIVVDNTLNCDTANELRKTSMKKLKNNTVKSLASMSKSMKLRDEVACISTNQLLHCMLYIVRSEELTEYL
ncbi:hypothetical protein PR048_011532 [Dryococelus australis]|uniref:Uncharacterized protein n=1 Tax=Dryococelus australis TaxID=614101 RepID=A0ABQ9HM07_9NEOP|nr:hypothetical protein PR048_011532 [Dryococelus australis]